MKNDMPDLLFSTREDFRAWLCEHAESSDGIWILFGKTKEVITLTANDALEEALCFGWIDGLIKSIDGTKYRKYFARRREKSPWSDKNKKMIDSLRERKLMTDLGELAIDKAKTNGIWDNSPSASIDDEQIALFAEKLHGYLLAYNNFVKMPRSAKTAYVRRHLSFKNEDTRQRDFLKIIDLIGKNMKPSINSNKDNMGHQDAK